MIDQEKFSKKLAAEKEGRGMLRTVAYCGLTIFIIGAAIMILGMFYIWPRPTNSALPDSWYKGEAINPSDELISSADWTVVFAGKMTDELIAKAKKPKNNLVDSDLAETLSAIVYLDQGEERPLTMDYLNEPIKMTVDEMYVVEFDCIPYHQLRPISRETTRYYVAPLRLDGGDASVITFALYDPESERYHQICIPFLAAEDIELRYSYDVRFEEQTHGQVYRLFIEVEAPAEIRKGDRSGYSTVLACE